MRISTGLIPFLLYYCCPSVYSNFCRERMFCYSPLENVRAELYMDERARLHLFYYPKYARRSLTLGYESGFKLTAVCKLRENEITLKPDQIGLVPIERRIELRRGYGGSEAQCYYYFNSTVFNNSAPIVFEYDGHYPSEEFTIDALKAAPFPDPRRDNDLDLTFEQRKYLSKAHAVLMIIGWLFFIPTAYLFSRFGRRIFKNQSWISKSVWLHLHYRLYFLGLLCITASVLCSFRMAEWNWRGTGSTARFTTRVHANLGAFSTVLFVSAVIAQIFFKCATFDSKYLYSLWIRRIALVSCFIAVSTLIIASFIFRNIWNSPYLVLFFLSVSAISFLMATIGFPILEKRKNGKTNIELLDVRTDSIEVVIGETRDEVPKVQLYSIICSICAVFATSVVLSLLIFS